MVSLAYSVDADDAFMFYAIAHGLVDFRGFTFEHRRGDTAWLNDLARSEGADVVAISAGAYPWVADRYLVLPHGASVGRGYGPVVVAKKPLVLEDLREKRVAVPGLTTTAYLVLRLMEPRVVPVVVPIAPFSAVFQALDDGTVDAALLIHEGRLLYEERGYHKVCEVGEWWLTETGLSLPLGVNVIRRALGPDTVASVSKILRESIEYALLHREEVIKSISRIPRGDASLVREGMLDRYLAMYANEDTRTMSAEALRGLQLLYEKARAAGLIPQGFSVEFAP